MLSWKDSANLKEKLGFKRAGIRVSLLDLLGELALLEFLVHLAQQAG